MQISREKNSRSQRGATLVVALVLLAVITIIGLASIRSSNLEIKMATSARDRADALRKSEEALDIIKELLDLRTNGSIPFPDLTPADMANAWPTTNSFSAQCTERNPAAQVAGPGGQVLADVGVNCFTFECNEGLCFTGDMRAATKALCRVENAAAGAAISRWQDDTVWDNANRHGVVKVPRDVESDTITYVDVKYIVEMLCFGTRSDQSMEDVNLADGVPLYRVTTRAVGVADRSTVVLQSVFKGNLL